MEGFILAAGLGTRLRPLTNERPKALVELCGMPLLELAINRVAAAGATKIVVNVYHMADMVEDYINSHKWPCKVVVSSERGQLLDTGGGLKLAFCQLSLRQDVLVHNVDVVSDLDLADVAHEHRINNNLVTLCVSRRPSKRLLVFDEDGRLQGRYDGGTLRSGWQALAFSGISVVSPELHSLLPSSKDPYPIIDEYIRLADMGKRIGAYLHDPDRWIDVGTPENLKKAEQWILSSNRPHAAS